MKIGETGKLKDDKDGQFYTWEVFKDGKMWMTQNYNYKSPNSVCYDNKETNGQKYGRMYDGNEAKSLAPAGWRIPTQEEFNGLLSKYGAKEITIDGGSGLKLMFGGICYSGGGNFKFTDVNEFGSYWTKYHDGNHNGGEPAAWDYKIYKYYTRSGYGYETQGRFCILSKNKCYVRYVKD